MSESHRPVYAFGEYRLDPIRRLLHRNGEPVPVAPRALALLTALVERRGAVVEKDELLRLVWPDCHVEEINLNVHVSALRKIFGEQPGDHRYIATVPRQGFTFVAPVQCGSADDDARADGDTSRAAAAPVAPAPPRRRPGIRRAAPVLLGLSLLALLLALPRREPSPPSFSASSIAVLPFQALTDEAQHLGPGMADAISASLGRTPLAVRSASASRRVAGDGDPLDVGRRLGVDLLLGGTVLRDGDRIRVQVELVAVPDGTLLWTGRFDEDHRDIFTVQESVASRLAEALTLHLESGPGEPRHSPDIGAYDAYLRGMFLWRQRTRPGLLASVRYFHDAIREDPRYALAHGALADSYALLALYSTNTASRGEYFELARGAATRALELSPGVPAAYRALALVQVEHDHDIAMAEATYRRGTAIAPADPTLRQRYAWLLMATDRRQRATAEMEAAVRLEPLSVANNVSFGCMLYLSRRYDAAAAQLRRTLELAPGNAFGHLYLGLVDEQRGNHASALHEIRLALDSAGDDPFVLGSLGHALASAGRHDEALVLLTTVDALTPDDAGHFAAALIHAGLDQPLRAVARLQDAVRRGATPPYPFWLDPRLAVLEGGELERLAAVEYAQAARDLR